VKWLAIALLVTGVLAEDGKLSQAEARKTKEPRPVYESFHRSRPDIIPADVHRLSRIRRKAETAVIAEATDLTSPKRYKNGTTEGEIFRSIRDSAGDQMPSFKSQIDKEEDIWNLVNFTRSLWPESERQRED
jgi:hypothetical protein